MTLFPVPDPGTGRRGQEARTLTPGQGRGDKRNKIAGTDVNTPVAIARCRDREWAEIHTPGHGYCNLQYDAFRVNYDDRQ